MITSGAQPHIIARLRHLAGPVPAGCRLTNTERLHLIHLIIEMVTAAQNTHESYCAARDNFKRQLLNRGMDLEALVKIVASNIVAKPPALADIIAVHPSLKPADCLD